MIIPVNKKMLFFIQDILESPIARFLKKGILKIGFLRKFLSSTGLISIGRKPKHVMLALTYDCQCNCAHCGVALNKKNIKELNTFEVFKLVDQLYEMNIRKLCLTGGEPLLRNDLINIIEYANERNIRVELDTNGDLLTDEMIKSLKNAGLKIIKISLDSPIPSFHDELRNINGLFEKVVASIKKCTEADIECHISSCLNKEMINNEYLQKMVDLAKSLQAKVRLLFPVRTGRLINSETEFNLEDKKKLRSFLEPGFAYLEADFFDNKNNVFFCGSQVKKFIYITCYGDVQPCCYMPFSFGNIKNNSLKEILRKMWKHEIFNSITWDCPMNDENFRKKYLSTYLENNKIPIELSVIN